MMKTKKDRPGAAEHRVRANHDVGHMIRVMRPDGMACDVYMTEAQVREARLLARHLMHEGVKQPLNDVIVELLQAGVMTTASRPEEAMDVTANKPLIRVVLRLFGIRHHKHQWY